MWLIDTTTHRLHRFIHLDVPKYGILSHRWEEEELSFSDYRDTQMIDNGWLDDNLEEERLFPMLQELRLHRRKRMESRKGWNKVTRLCEQSRSFGLKWAWLDTICIDNSSSAELQEAINSMYGWYQQADACFVYLNDVTAEQASDKSTGSGHFKSSKWFTRGWTLQELLAPTYGRIHFLDKEWRTLPSDRELLENVQSVTKIPLDILQANNSAVRRYRVLKCSVAQRMSWAAKRKVTRPEDMAYSLMGLFDVNMTMLYGEGAGNAFQRLQLEIMKKSCDETILAWDDSLYQEINRHGPLAQSAADFEKSGNCRKARSQFMENERRMRGVLYTARGLEVELLFLDRERSRCLPDALRRSARWTSRFAVWLCSAKSMSATGNDKVRIFMPLKHWLGNEYERAGGLIAVSLTAQEKTEISSHNEIKRVCIRMSKSFE